MGNEQGRMLSPEELRAREISQMDSEMKKKLSGGGIKYNMIKGDRNTGKTNLWRRLQGLSYQDAYIPTPEIQIATINWSYKVSDDVVKVEVWDVVDKAKSKKKQNSSSSSLKLSNADDDEDDDDDDEPTPNVPIANQGPDTRMRTGSFAVNSLDANTVDVLRGAHAVIIMVDPTKKWTWDYAQREVPKIAAENIYTLVLANYRDMGEHRVVTEYEIKEFCREQGDMVKCLEASMLNGYGLKSVVCFFNIPFLYMQRQYIQQQLDRNMEEIRTAEDELKLINKEQGYDFYIKWLNQNMKDKKAKKQQVAQQQQAPPPGQQPQPTPPRPEPPKQEPPKQEPPKEAPKKEAPKPQPPKQEPPKQPPTPTAASTPPSTPVPTPAPAAKPAEQKSGFFSRIFSSNKPEDKKPEPVKAASSAPVEDQRKIENVDEFAPAGDLDDGFFGDSPPKPSHVPTKAQLVKTPSKPKDPDYSDDDDAPNPLVARAIGDSDDDAPNPLVAKDEGGSDEDEPKPKSKPKSQPKKAAPPPKVVKEAPQKSTSQSQLKSSVGEADKVTKAPSQTNVAASKPVSAVTSELKKSSSTSASPPAKQPPKQIVQYLYAYEDTKGKKAPAVKKDNFYDDDDEDEKPAPKAQVKKDKDFDDDDEDDVKPTSKKPVIKRDADLDDEDEDEKPKKPVVVKKDKEEKPKKAPVVKRNEDEEEDNPNKSPFANDNDDVDDAFDNNKSSDSVRKEDLKSSSGSASSGRQGERGDRDRERRERGDRGERGERRERGDKERRRRPDGERRARPEGERSKRSSRREEYEEPPEDNEVFSSTKIALSPKEETRTPASPTSAPPPSSSKSPPPSTKSPPPAAAKVGDAFNFAPEEEDLDDFYND